MGIDDDQLLAIQNDLRERLKARDEVRERAVTTKLHELEQKHEFANAEQKHEFANAESLKHFAQVSELLEPAVKDGQAKVKPADKMLMIPALFHGKKLKKAKTHYQRFDQYIKFQTKEGNIQDTTKEAIELFEHTLDKKAYKKWFQQHKAEFKDLTTLKNMFLARYNPWEKTKRGQFQSWNNLSFDPQKTDVGEQINLVSTLGNMLGQDKQLKMEKFTETMPTIIQTHLIIEPNWKMVIKKEKNLEHIIHKCEALAIAPSSLQGAGAVPSLYSHTAQSQDQGADNIPKPFKNTKGRGGKNSGKGKQKSQQQPQSPPPEEEEQYEETNNYYHNENYRGNYRGCRPHRDQAVLKAPTLDS